MQNMANIVLLFYILSYLTFGYCQVPGFGQCPNVDVKEGFEVKKYMGKWYEVERYFPILFELGTQCGQATYTLKENGHVDVLNKGYIKILGKVNSVNGDAFAPNASVPAKLVVSFPQASAFAKGNYWVLDTDYRSYSIVYSCSSLGGFVHADIIWILGRQKTLPDATLKRLHQFIEGQGLRTFYLKAQTQTDCPYEDEPQNDKEANTLLKYIGKPQNE